MRYADLGQVLDELRLGVLRSCVEDGVGVGSGYGQYDFVASYGAGSGSQGGYTAGLGCSSAGAGYGAFEEAYGLAWLDFRGIPVAGWGDCGEDVVA